MVLVREYRIIMPMTVEEYRIGQLYMTAQTQLMEALQEDGAGVELLQNETRVFDDMGKGIYTRKIFHIDRRFPPWLRAIAPKSGCTLYEEAKNCYPVTSTTVTLPLFAKFKMRIDSVHYADRGKVDNIHKLSDDILKKRKVVTIDIGTFTESERKKKMYAGDNSDPRTFKSNATGRGPLRDGWVQEVEPVMCAYKLVYAEFEYWGLQGKIEEFMQEYEANLFRAANRQLFCWMDEWYGLSRNDVRRFEMEVAERTNLITRIKDGHVTDTKIEDLPPIKPKRTDMGPHSLHREGEPGAGSPSWHMKGQPEGDTKDESIDRDQNRMSEQRSYTKRYAEAELEAPGAGQAHATGGDLRMRGCWAGMEEDEDEGLTTTVKHVRSTSDPFRQMHAHSVTLSPPPDRTSRDGVNHSTEHQRTVHTAKSRDEVHNNTEHQTTEHMANGSPGQTRTVPNGAAEEGYRSRVDADQYLGKFQPITDDEGDRTRAPVGHTRGGSPNKEGGFPATEGDFPRKEGGSPRIEGKFPRNEGVAAIGARKSWPSGRSCVPEDLTRSVEGLRSSGFSQAPRDAAASGDPSQDQSWIKFPPLLDDILGGVDNLFGGMAKLHRVQQRDAGDGDAKCSVAGCGKYAQYRYIRTGDGVCSVECKIRRLQELDNLHPSGLPHGWEEGVDKGGRTFYINHVSKSTQRGRPLSSIT